MIYFLKAKHWQIFILIFVVPLFFQIIFNYLDILNNIVVNMISTIIFLGVFFTWIWSVVDFFTSNMSKNISGKKNFNKLIIFLSTYYLTTTIILFSSLDLNIFLNYSTKLILGIIVIPLHLISLCGFYYIMYLFAKVIRKAELKRKVIFKDFASEFLMIVCFPIGVWFIQPKINKLYCISLLKNNKI